MKNTNTHNLTETQNTSNAKCIRLGIDVHAQSYRVVRQIDNATPQPAQKFTPKAFLLWAKKQLTQAQHVYSCYEAGPLGYGLHRALEAMGIHNVVVRPQNWDELHQGVKNDKTDALALVQRLDRYVQGNQVQPSPTFLRKNIFFPCVKKQPTSSQVSQNQPMSTTPRGGYSRRKWRMEDGRIKPKSGQKQTKNKPNKPIFNLS